MSVQLYYQVDNYKSYVATDPADEIVQQIYAHRGRQYLPTDMGGAGSYIADTAINVCLPPSGNPLCLRETSDWDHLRVPSHKLRATAHFFVTRITNGGAETINASGWIVPYTSEAGLPMENRRDEGGTGCYDWTPLFRGEDSYLRAHGLGPLPSTDIVEIGRLCAPKLSGDTGSYLPVLLAFKTLHRFLEEIGVKNYVCAAIDVPGQRYASLYEGMGLRRVAQYEAPTVTGIEKWERHWRPVVRTLRYWALHMNVPHTQQRVRNGEFGQPEIPGAARLNRRLLSFVTPYLFDPPTGRWEPDHESS